MRPTGNQLASGEKSDDRFEVIYLSHPTIPYLIHMTVQYRVEMDEQWGPVIESDYVSQADRMNEGRSRRTNASRKSHAGWTPPRSGGIPSRYSRRRTRGGSKA